MVSLNCKLPSESCQNGCQNTVRTLSERCQNAVRTLLWVGYCQNVASTARERAKCEHLQDGWCERHRLADRHRLCRLLCGRGARRRRRPLEPIPLICLGCGHRLLGRLARARRAPARLRRGRTADVKSRCHRCCCCFGGNKRRLCGECRGGARAVWRWCQRTARRRRKRHVRSRVTRGCRLGCSLRVYLDRRARALRFVLRRFGLLLPGRGFFGSVAGLLAAEQTIPRARLLPRASMAVLACSCSTVTAVCAPAWCHCTHFFLNCQNRLSEQANLDSKLKVEVCVRTGTKFVSEQGLRTPQRECVALARLGGRAVC